jgi:hypothetical protein
MITMSLVDVAAPAILDFVPLTPVLDRAVVRVIWGRALGSVYQRSVNGRSSVFSRPLNCPECQGPFEVHQPSGNSPDQLVGKCRCCEAAAQLFVGAEGRISMVEPN